MSLSQSPVLKPGAAQSAMSHIHAVGEVCPTCDQPIPLLDSVEKLVDDMLELDVKEQSAHKAIWEKRGRMLNLVLKAHGDFCGAVDRIIGTAD